MSNKYFGGEIYNRKVNEEVDNELLQLIAETPAKVDKCMDTLHIQDAIDTIFALARRSNKYIDETSPWALAKDEEKKDRLQTVLYNLLEAIRVIAVLIRPYLPETSERILDQLNTKARDYDSVLTFGQLENGIHVVEKPELLFARIDANEMMKRINEDNEAKSGKKYEPIKEQITIDDFAKLDIRVGTVVESKKHPDADRLLVSKIDIGSEVRTIVSGIAEKVKPEEFVGQKVLVVCNLAPHKFRGIESQGMILAGESGDVLEVINSAKLENGTSVH